jgi:antitoxin component of MazEF toxin-antitoxin module
MPADAVYELNEFIAAYRRAPKGFEDWQIASRIASVVASAIKRCEMDKVIEYISTALDASGIDRYAVYSAYIHGLSPNVVEALYHIFPNMAPRIGANAPITTQLPAVETPTVTADTAHLPTPPVTTAEAKGKHQQETTPKRAPVAGPGEVVLRVGGLAEYETHLGVVRLPLSVMERLGLKPGDFVEIIGATSTYAVVQPTEEEDVVKMDEVTRSNAGAELGDYVCIKKAVLPPAEKIVLRTNQPIDAEYVKRYLLFKPLAKGNTTAVPQQDKTITLRVENVVPAPAAYVQLSTKIEIQHDNTAHSKQQQPEGQLMYKSSTPEVPLRVFDANKEDYGRSIVRIPARIMTRLGIYPGDYVEIVGRKTAYAQAWLVNPEDEDKDIVQMDGIIRQSAGVGIGDTVKIKKAALKPAQKVVLAPTEPVRVDPEYLKEQILGKPVARGQAIDVPFYGDSIRFVVRFVVVQVQPEPAAYVSIDTDVIVEATKIEVQHDNSVNSKQQGILSAPEVLLQVFNAKKLDYGRSTVRIPVRIMKKLGVEPGDYVEIVGRKTVYAQVWPVYPEDEDKDVILVDSVIRKNANINIGDIVKVKKAVLRPAQKVVLAPTKPAEVDPEYLKKQILLGKPVTRGQIIIMPFYEDVIKFVVLQVEPEPAAYVSIDTDVIITGVPYRHA